MNRKSVTEIKTPNVAALDLSAALSSMALLDEDEYAQVFVRNADASYQNASHISISSSRLDGVRLSGCNLPKSRFVDAYFDKCDLSNVEMKLGRLTRVRFTDCKLTGLKISEGEFHDIVFEECLCDMMQIFGSELKNVSFKNCRLTNADLRSCKLKNVKFENCQLQKSEIYGAKLDNVDCRGTSLQGLKANASDLKGLVIDYQQALDLAEYFASVIGIHIVKD
jgi:uncharacterized protein YjbI with pentapeptide repeats